MTIYEAMIIALTSSLVLINALKLVIDFVKETSNRSRHDQWIG